MSRHRSFVVVLWLLVASVAWGQPLTDPPLVEDCNRTESPLVGTAGQCATPPCWSQKINPASADNLEANGVVCRRDSVVNDFDAGQVWWNPTTFGADMAIAAVLVDATPATAAHLFTLYVRLQEPGTAGFDAYACRYDITNGAYFIEVTNGSAVGMGTLCPVTLNDGDSMGCRIIGTTISWQRKVAGVWGEICSVSDSSLTGVGYVGLSIQSNTTTIDQIRAGAVSTETMSQGAIMPLLQ